MKKIVFFFLAFLFVVNSCKNGKPTGETLLGDGTPYYQYPEKMIGNVNKVIEKNYWAIPEGDSFIKGNLLTQADRDSLGGWTSDYEATFDNAGNLVSCVFTDENNKVTARYEISADNDANLTGRSTAADTLQYYDKFKLDADGKRIGFERYQPKADTIVGKFEVKTSSPENTMEYSRVNTKGAVLYKIILFFNDQKQFTHSEYYGKDGAFRLSYEVKYNEKGTVSELTILDKDKKLSAVNYLTYEYDSKGNWIKAYVKDQKGIVVIEERTITYFE